MIAQPFLKPIVCHAGYDADGVKRAIVWANAGKLTGHFEVIDVTANVQPPGRPPVVYRGELREAGSHIWGGNNYVADFSDLRREGLYWVRLVVRETKEVVESYVFRVKRGLYLDLARKAARWFYYQRCGTEVPGWHGPCHTQDAIILEDGTRLDATGGWHDAGDYGKWLSSGAYGVWALASMAEEVGGELGERGVREVLDEAAWEARYFCKVYYEKLGTFLQVFASSRNVPLSDEFPPMENVCVWLGAPEKEPPRVVTLEQSLDYYPPTLTRDVHVAASLAKLGRLISRYDPELSERCISIARDVCERARGAEPERDRDWYLLLVSRALLLNAELYRATGEREYLEGARAWAEELLSLQRDDGSFYRDVGRSAGFEQSHFHIVALCEVAESELGGGLRERAREAFRRWLECVEPLTRVSPFGQVGTRTEGGEVRNLGPNSTNRALGAFAWAFATAAIMFGEPRYLEMAERQLQWILGLNPCDVSMMAGVGAGPGCYHHRYCFVEGHEDGVVPGGIVNGIVGANGGVMDVGDFRTGNFVVSDGLPVDYPIIDTDARGWTYAYLTNEYWVINNAWFIMGAVRTHRALRLLRGR